MPASKLPKNYGERLREPRLGVMLHYDASASDEGAVAWLFSDPRCEVSYTVLVLDDGTPVNIAPMEARAWHAGVCRSSDPKRLPYRDANSAFYGLAIAAKAGDIVKAAQLDTLVHLIRHCFKREGWSLEEAWRVRGHETEAWPRGRRHDPTGPNPSRPVLSVERVRELLAA